MSIYRNEGWPPAALAIALLTAVSVAWPAASLAQEKAPPKPPVTDRATGQKAPAAEVKPPAPVFVPREKVSAGKPVSFPSDI